MQQNKKQKTPVIDEVDTDALEAILQTESAINARLVNRTAAVRGMLLAVVSGHNLMLDGPPGVAKTKMGALFAEAVSDDPAFTFFQTQMMKSTLPEQLFGPINITKMRQEEPVYEYCTRDMLPSAHFAVLEEVYRASEMVLSTMLTLLNERHFHNGGKIVPCPLITAIGTTNFVATGEEIEAFNDRWLLRCLVKPLGGADQRMKMLTLSLSTEKKALGARLSLLQIRDLQERCRAVSIPTIILDLYEQLASQMSKNPQLSVKITDRRLVQTLDLMRASAVLNNRTEANEDDLFAVDYGFTSKGNDSDEQIFGAAYQATVGNFAALKAEAEQVGILKERADTFMAAYDPAMSQEKATKLAAACRKLLAGMSNRPCRYTSPTNEAIFASVHERVDQLLRDATEISAK